MDHDNHPITPPPELVHQWCTYNTAHKTSAQLLHHIAAQAAQWGYEQRGAANEAELQKARDEELDACCALADERLQDGTSLRAARRPKPKSQAEEALEALDSFEGFTGSLQETDVIRAALERLRELEKSNG